jgi:arabinofuranosyltransferase
MASQNKGTLFFLFILAGYALYAGVYIYKTSFVAGGERYFVLFDDAMISMRYARNLAAGHGLVWNPGAEPVEGYTNPLWVVFMAFFHLFPISTPKMSLFIQASGAAFLLANLFFVQKIARFLSSSWLVALLAVLLTALYAPLNNWGLQGMEVSLLVLVASAAVWMALQSLSRGRFNPWIYALLGAATLVRIDMAVTYLVVLGFYLLADPAHRRQNLLWGAGLLVFFLLGQTLFRLAYYGEFLPNTYYLKMEGYPLASRVMRGLYVLFRFILSFNWLLFVLPFTVLFFRRDRAVVLLVLVILGQLVYSVYVGGDAWEHRGGANRYISIAMPLFFILFVYAGDLLRLAILEKARPGSGSLQLISLAGLVVFILASMLNMNALQDARSLERWALIRQPLFIEGNKEYVQIALALKKITRPQASVAVVSAGAIPYFSDLYAIDLLGKNDAWIAHSKAHGAGNIFNLDRFRPGHMKWDYDYAFGQLQPDVVVQLWGDTETAEAYLVRDYVVGGAPGDMAFSLRKGSPNVLWEQVVLVP